jgi:hypothetical protein
MHRERPKKPIASIPIYLVANNLQLHNARELLEFP